MQNACMKKAARARVLNNNPKSKKEIGRQERQIKKTQDELQWIVAQRLLSALTIPGFS